jgi:hypothetical protein
MMHAIGCRENRGTARSESQAHKPRPSDLKRSFASGRDFYDAPFPRD